MGHAYFVKNKKDQVENLSKNIHFKKKLMKIQLLRDYNNK